MSVQIRLFFILSMLVFSLCSAAARMPDDAVLLPPSADDVMQIRAELEYLAEKEALTTTLILDEGATSECPVLCGEMQRAFQVIRKKLGGLPPIMLQIEHAPSDPSVSIAINNKLSVITFPISFIREFLRCDDARYKEFMLILAHEIGHQEDPLNCFYRTESFLPSSLELTMTATNFCIALMFGYLVGSLLMPERIERGQSLVPFFITLLCIASICSAAKVVLSHKLEYAADAYGVRILSDPAERHLVLESALDRFLDRVKKVSEDERREAYVASCIKQIRRILTHPSVERRVRHIKKLYNPSDD